jgi:hypothetical protein
VTHDERKRLVNQAVLTVGCIYIVGLALSAFFDLGIVAGFLSIPGSLWVGKLTLALPDSLFRYAATRSGNAAALAVAGGINVAIIYGIVRTFQKLASH